MALTYRIRGTGNSVADYTEIVRTCGRCQGTGLWEVDKNELLEYMRRVRYIMTGFMKIYREWKKTGSTICPTCEGRGKLVRRY